MQSNKIQFLILVFMLISISMSVVLFIQNRTVIEAYRLRELKMVTELLASDHEAATAGIRQFLIIAAGNLEDNGFNSKTCDDVLRRESVVYPYFINFGVVDLEGNIICSGAPLTGSGVRFKEAPDFQKLLASQNFTTSGYRISDTTGRPSVRFLQPFFDTRGKLSGAVFTSFGTEWLNGFSPNFQFSDEVTITKFDRDGNVFMRYPNPIVWSGTDQGDSELFKKMTSLGEGTATVRGLDGKERIYHFRPIFLNGEISAYVAAGL